MRSAMNRRMAANTSSTTFGARPSDGSSSRSRRGRAANARASASICCSPPDSVRAAWSWRSASRGNSSRAACRSSVPATLGRGGGEAEVVGDGEVREDRPPLGHEVQAAAGDGRRGRARRGAGPRAARSRPRGRTKPAMVRSRVDLPAPFGPSSATHAAVVHGEVDAVQHVAVGAVAGPHALDDEERLVSHAWSRPEVGVADDRHPGHLGGGALGDADAEVEDVEALADAEHHGHVVLDEHDAEAAACARRSTMWLGRARRSRPRRAPTTARRATASPGSAHSARPSSTSRATPGGRSAARSSATPARPSWSSDLVHQVEAAVAAPLQQPDAGWRRGRRPRWRRRGSRATVIEPNTSRRWNVRPSPARARRCDGQPATSSPPRCTVPRSGRTVPAMAPNSVVLPAPFGPMMPTISPAVGRAPTRRRRPRGRRTGR